jgi:hypothetical protein
VKLFSRWLAVFCLFFGCGLLLVPPPANAQPQYGYTSPDIGTFQTPTGNWTIWIGWDANFSETYVPEGESYAWVVYFAPEAVYVALQSSKSFYSGVNVNAGFKYFYGSLNLGADDRLTGTLIDNDLKSVGLSKNLFDISTPGTGVGVFGGPSLSFALSAGLTFLRENNSDSLQRGIQVDSGVSVSYDLMSLPLPFSVSLGTDCNGQDPPELCSFIGFYPIIIWDIDEQTSQNPVDEVISYLETAGQTGSNNIVDIMGKMLHTALQIMQSNSEFVAFLESSDAGSGYDMLIAETEEWLESGDTKNLPENMNLPDPAQAHQTMKPLFSVAQMAFELGYQRGCEANTGCTTRYTGCVVEEYCTPGEPCVVEITAEEIAGHFPEKTAADFEGAELIIDNPVEQYLVSQQETTEKLQIENGKAVYTFVQNTETPVALGVRMEPASSLVDTAVELCRRLVRFTSSVPPVDFDQPDACVILTDDSLNHLPADTTTVVYGSSGQNRLYLESGAAAELINFPGSNLIEFESDALLFEVSRSGTVVTFEGSDGTILKIPATSQEQTICRGRFRTLPGLILLKSAWT